jgi:hypothetical protein
MEHKGANDLEEALECLSIKGGDADVWHRVEIQSDEPEYDELRRSIVQWVVSPSKKDHHNDEPVDQGRHRKPNPYIGKINDNLQEL